MLEELAVQLSMPADAIGNTQSLCSSFRRPMPRLRDLRITSPLYCEMLVRVFGDSEHIAENMTAVQKKCKCMSLKTFVCALLAAVAVVSAPVVAVIGAAVAVILGALPFKICTSPS